MKIALLLFTSLLLGMCSNQSASSFDVKSAPSTTENLEIESPRTSEPVTPPPLGSEPIVSRKQIRTANLVIEVNNYNKSRKELENIIRRFNAEISQESELRQSYRIENNLVIRVQPQKLDSLIETIENIASEIDSKNISVEDVTRQYVDLESRLATKRAAIEQYKALLKNAQTTSDVLEVHDKMNAMIEEVESAEAQLRVLRDQIQLSTLNLNMYQIFNNIAARHEGFGSRLGNALSGGWQGLLSVLVGLIYLWPLLLTVGIILFFVLRTGKKAKPMEK